jgi:hypothetical protein
MSTITKPQKVSAAMVEALAVKITAECSTESSTLSLNRHILLFVNTISAAEDLRTKGKGRNTRTKGKERDTIINDAAKAGIHIALVKHMERHANLETKVRNTAKLLIEDKALAIAVMNEFIDRRIERQQQNRGDKRDLRHDYGAARNRLLHLEEVESSKIIAGLIRG